MAGIKLSMVVFMVVMVASMQMQTSMAQTRHVVGDALGWTIPQNGAAAYTAWAAQQNFTVGDTLVFNFTTGVHNVAQVTQAAYGPCATANPITIATTGPATISLTTAGSHYYICTVGSHCQIGQKLSINVSTAAAAPAPATPPPAAAPTTPPPAAAPTTPPPAATPTTSPPAATPTPAPTTSPTPTSSPAPSPADSTSPPAPSTTGTAPASSTTPSPTGSATPAPPSNAASSSFTAVVPATFLAIGLALFW